MKRELATTVRTAVVVLIVVQVVGAMSPPENRKIHDDGGDGIIIGSSRVFIQFATSFLSHNSSQSQKCNQSLSVFPG